MDTLESVIEKQRELVEEMEVVLKKIAELSSNYTITIYSVLTHAKYVYNVKDFLDVENLFTFIADESTDNMPIIKFKSYDEPIKVRIGKKYKFKSGEKGMLPHECTITAVGKEIK